MIMWSCNTTPSGPRGVPYTAEPALPPPAPSSSRTRRLDPNNMQPAGSITLRRGPLSRTIPAPPFSSTADRASLFGYLACSIRTALTCRSPTSPSLRGPSGSSWLDWRPVMWRVPADSAGQRCYRRMDSSPSGRHGAGDERASRSPFPYPYPRSPSLRRAFGSSGWGALLRGPEPAVRQCCRASARVRPGSGPAFPPSFRHLGFGPTLAQQLRARQQPRRR
jgi:hypothetical protein